MIILGIILSYLIGSIPTGYLFGRALQGIDIRDHGSGNLGATNVFRILGKKAGFTVLVLDILKGIIPVVFLASLFGLREVLHLVLLGVAAVCGHNWTIFLKFKGGKGIATSFGVLIGLTIKIAAIRPVLIGVVLIWLATFLITRIISVASILAATCLPILMAFTNQAFIVIVLGIMFCIFVVLRHKANIRRFFAGQEPKVPLPFGPKK